MAGELAVAFVSAEKTTQQANFLTRLGLLPKPENEEIISECTMAKSEERSKGRMRPQKKTSSETMRK